MKGLEVEMVGRRGWALRKVLLMDQGLGGCLHPGAGVSKAGW
jgi:hypothetical protein